VKVTYVVPRYGVEVTGGAEGGVRMLAERLVSGLGWQVEVLTSCALDSRTWADEYEPGTVDVNGVTVHRFRSQAGRDPGFDRYSRTVMTVPHRTTREEQDRWVDLQGPLNPSVVDAIPADDADVVAFSPYLFHPTVRGLPLAGDRAVLHAAAHDELPIRLPVYRSIFTGARGLVYYTPSERRLVEERFPVAATPQLVLGLGIDDPVPGGTPPVEAPYLLYVGRVDDGKGTRVLAEFFAAYKARNPGPLRLVIAGRVLDPPPPHPDVVVLGEVDDATKWALYEHATVFVNPSAYESFSIVLMEAWEAGLPAIVNGRSEVMREHCERSGGGLWFDGYARFEAVLARLGRDADVRARLGTAGRAYVDTHYRWPALLARYRSFLEGVVARRA
jgi:glycosyltransferase involved in cell wall biosynthesis